MSLGTVSVFSAIALALDIISCFFSFIVMGFYAYVISGYFGNSPWFVDLGLSFALICFLVLLATSILGCIGCGRQKKNIAIHGTKFGLDAFAWVLTLISAAINTSKSDQNLNIGNGYQLTTSLDTYLNACDYNGFDEACAWSVGIVLLWTTFCLLVISLILHGLAIIGVRNHKDQNVPQQDTAVGIPVAKETTAQEV